MDFSFKFGSKKSRAFFGDEFVDSLTAKINVLQQESLCKENLMKALFRSPFSLYAIPSYYVTNYEEIVQHMQYITKGFLKPTNGKMGISTGKLTHIPKGLQIEDFNGVHVFSEEFCNDFYKKVESQRFGYGLLQPCFDFSLDDNHAVDFRLLRHRGLNGEWEEVATYARIGETSLVSNVSQGGYIGDAKVILQQIAGDKADPLYEEIMMLGREIPRLIRQMRGDSVFCLGIDVAVDRETLRPFILEANTYPGTKYHDCQLAESRVRYYKYLLES